MPRLAPPSAPSKPLPVRAPAVAPRTVNRRRFLGYAGALAGGLLIGRHIARGAGGHPFSLGVASGEPSADGFVLWTRIAPIPLAGEGMTGLSGPVSVGWAVATDEGMRNVVRSGTVETDGRFAHSVHVEVAGQEARRTYW